MSDQGLKELYIDELKDLYNAENQLVKALPKMARAASSDELRRGFEEHLEQTKGHVQRLEKLFQALGESPKGKKCKGMEGLIEEGSEVMEERYEGGVMDAALIGAAQRVEHYEIAGYGTVRSMAETLAARGGTTGNARVVTRCAAAERWFHPCPRSGSEPLG
jgi:ferritin-like metal-binding protein YciE